jgi:hypothetical protein
MNESTGLIEDTGPTPVWQADSHTRQTKVLTVAGCKFGVDLSSPLHALQICNAHIEPRSKFAGVNDPIAFMIKLEPHGEVSNSSAADAGLRLTVAHRPAIGHLACIGAGVSASSLGGADINDSRRPMWPLSSYDLDQSQITHARK